MRKIKSSTEGNYFIDQTPKSIIISNIKRNAFSSLQGIDVLRFVGDNLFVTIYSPRSVHVVLLHTFN